MINGFPRDTVLNQIWNNGVHDLAFKLEVL